MDNIIDVQSLSKRQGKFEMKDINFRLEPGYIMGLIGPNGAGKSTLMHIIAGLRRTDSGSVSVMGMNPLARASNDANGRTIRAKLGFVFDECNYYPHLRVKDIVAMVRPFYNEWCDVKCTALLDEFEIERTKKISELSHGMRMKLQLAVALSHNAQLIMLDEPTGGLDPLVRRSVLEKLRDVIQDDNRAVLFSTHITSDLERIADKITMLNEGQLCFSEETDALRERCRRVYGDLSALERVRADLIGISSTRYGFEGLATSHEAAHRCEAYCNVEPASLEDIMLGYAGKEHEQ